jgi:hypothetical protein
MSEVLGDVVMNVVVRSFLTAGVIIIDKQVVQRRDIVIRRGRQLQDLLRIPQCIQVITDTDPGMPDGEIRMSAEFLGLCCFISAFGLVLALAKGRIWDPWVLSFGATAPGYLLSVLWLVLVVSKRRRMRSPMLTDKKAHHTPHTATQAGRNVELERSITWIWQTVGERCGIEIICPLSMEANDQRRAGERSIVQRSWYTLSFLVRLN